MTRSVKSSVFTRSRLDICNYEIPEIVVPLYIYNCSNYFCCFCYERITNWARTNASCFYWQHKHGSDISLDRTSWVLLALSSEGVKTLSFFPSIAKYSTSKGRHTFSNRAVWHFTFFKIYDLQSGRMTYFSYNVIFWNMFSFSLWSSHCPSKQEEN